MNNYKLKRQINLVQFIISNHQVYNVVLNSNNSYYANIPSRL